MKSIRSCMVLVCYCSLAVVLFNHCDARTMPLQKDISIPKTENMKHLKILEVAKSLNMLMDVSVKDSYSSNPYVNSPLTLPPYDSLSPLSLPDNTNNNSPPYCVYPPPNPESPSAITPTPVVYTPTPIPIIPPPSTPELSSSPPIVYSPTPTSISPPSIPLSPYYEPSPPSGSILGPPVYVPSPIGFAPSPPVFEPPVVYPPPTTTPPPPSTTGSRGTGVWCVAKPSVPDPIIQEAMSYACGSGADCDPLQPNGQCFTPNTLLAHASFAFNSYWQRTKVAGGTCSFGGTAILVTVDPSSQGCRFDNV